jgi:hypothetical protein
MNTLKTLNETTAMKTLKIKLAPENKFTVDPIDQVNEWLFWTLITIVALANSCTLYQILTAY